MPNLETIVDVATLLGVAIALVTVILGVAEYKRQGALKRAEHFSELRVRLESDENHLKIRSLLERNDASLEAVSNEDRMAYLGIYEEIAIALNSGLIKENVAHYMFGYFAIRCWESDHFWHNLNRNSHYWSLFKQFAERMRKFEMTFQNRTSQIKF